MIGVVRICLYILLALCAVLLILLMLFLFVRTGVEAVGADGEVSVDLRWGVLRLPLYPPPGKKKESPKRKKHQKPKAEEEPSEKPSKSLNWAALDLGELLDFALRLLDELTDTLRISRLRVRILFGTDDAAKTGLLLGGASALCGMLVPFLENTFAMKEYSVSVDADFDALQTRWAFTLFCSLRPGRLFYILLRHGREIYGLYKKLIQKEEAISYE